MSVVHINKRFTDDQKSFEEQSYSDKSLLLISANSNVEEFSIDLTVGEEWSEKYGPTSNEMHQIAVDGVSLPRHGSFVVASAESIRVPHNMYGILVPTGSLFLDKGVLVAPAKVEPSFSGNLKLRLFNTTSFKHTLKRGDKLGSVVFFSTEATKFQPQVTKSSVRTSKPVSPAQRLSLWFRRNIIQVISWSVTILGGSMVAALVSHFVLQRYFPVTPQSSAAPAPAPAPPPVIPLPLEKKTP